jgi:hypothetical protein
MSSRTSKDFVQVRNLVTVARVADSAVSCEALRYETVPLKVTMPERILRERDAETSRVAARSEKFLTSRMDDLVLFAAATRGLMRAERKRKSPGRNCPLRLS